MRVAVITGGVGGARFLRGLEALTHTPQWADLSITAVANIGDDITLHDLRICPDLDTVMYTLGGGIDDERGWGRTDETFTVHSELTAYGAGPAWFGLGDRDLATHLIRTQMLNAGYALSDVTAALCKRWDIGIDLLPMSNDRIETHVTVDHDGERKAMHFQQWWLEHKAEIPAQSFAYVGADTATAAPGVIAALSEADAIVLAPSNPVVSIAPVLAVPGIKEAVMQRPVVGVSPIIAGAAVRGYADACLRAIDVETDAAAVARHFGARAHGGLLNGWLVDDSDHEVCAALTDEGIVTKAVPLWMRDVPTASAMAEASLLLAQDLGA